MLRPLLLSLAVFALTRLLYVAAMGDVFLYGEELEKGFVAVCLLGDVDVPYARLPYHPYEGGGFVASHVKALAFALMGSSILAHKACAIAWGLLVVAASVRLLHRHGGGARASDSASALGGVLLALGPAHFQRESLLHLGIHFEALLFVALVLDQGLRVSAVDGGAAPRRRDLLGLGLAAGFGTYFSYQVALAVGVVAGLLLVRSLRSLLSPTLVAATLLGLSPLIWMATVAGGEVLDLHGEAIGASVPGFLESIRAGLSAPLAVGSALLGAGAAIAGAAAAPPETARRVAAVTLLAFAGVWCAAAAWTGLFVVSPSEVHWFPLLRAAPLVWALLMLVGLLAGPALALEGVARGGAAAKVARSSAAALIGIGLIHAARIVDEGQLGRAVENLRHLAQVRGDDPRGALSKIGPRLEGDRSTADGSVEAEVLGRFLTEEVGPALITDVVAAVTQSTEARAEALEGRMAPLLSGIPGGLEAARRGLGSPLFHYRYPGRLREALESESLSEVDAEAMGRFGLGWYGATDLSGEVRVARGALMGRPFLRGVGARVFRTAVMQPYWGPTLLLRPGAVRRTMVERATALSAEERGALLSGFDAEALTFGVDDPTWPRVEPPRGE
ncbi:MAG: hypothetical protein VX460_08265 [Planctomycetota bacterium]|nr:hypothetical protein [Planctomycetota bacterium]